MFSTVEGKKVIVYLASSRVLQRTRGCPRTVLGNRFSWLEPLLV